MADAELSRPANRLAGRVPAATVDGEEIERRLVGTELFQVLNLLVLLTDRTGLEDIDARTIAGVARRQ
jgi:hypothetical protein